MNTADEAFERRVTETLAYLDTLGANDAEVAEMVTSHGWPGCVALVVHQAARDGADPTGAVAVVTEALHRRFGSRPPHPDWPKPAPWEIAGHG